MSRIFIGLLLLHLPNHIMCSNAKFCLAYAVRQYYYAVFFFSKIFNIVLLFLSFIILLFQV